ncbi:MAG TPA: hypothetical protein VFE71_04435 [Bacteroidales bacterium]|nr:hypothetical protein [Bacteroidales bacterium]
MNLSKNKQGIFPDLNFDASTIIKNYEDLYENPCGIYFELKKVFTASHEKITSEVNDSFIYQPQF